MDQNVVRALRVRGIDVQTAIETGMTGHADREHLAFAASQGRVLCTYNVGDFSALHAEYLADGRQHAGILLVQQQRYTTGELIRRMLHLVSGLSASEMVNRAEYLSAWEPIA